MVDNDLLSQGYKLNPSRYQPHLGNSRLQLLISSHPTKRFFDVKQIRLPTFYNRVYQKTQISRHELSPKESFQVCMGRFCLEAYQGFSRQGFSFGGALHVSILEGDLYCDFTSTAPIFMVGPDPVAVNNLIVDEILEFLAEKEAKLGQHEDEMYGRLAKFDPYAVFLACLVSLQEQLEGVPASLRRDKYCKTAATIQKVIEIVRKTDGWDGCSPTLEELLTSKVS